MTPIISAIIPTFNRPKLVQEAIESILSQRGGFSIEIIVVDDGSSEETEHALRKYSDKIRYVRQENSGLNVARNHALRLAQGRYIALLDDDDVWLPFKTALQMAALERFPEAGFVHSNFGVWKPGVGTRSNGLGFWFTRPWSSWDDIYSRHDELLIEEPKKYGLEERYYKVHYGDVYYHSLFSPMVLPSAAIVRRDAIGDLRFPESDPSCGDWEFFSRLSHRCGGVFLEWETTLNRSHEDTWRLTRIDSTIQIRRYIDMIRRVWRQDHEFVRLYSNDIDAVEAECLRRLGRGQMVKGDRKSARLALAELGRLKSMRRVGDIGWRVVANVPMSGHVFRAAKAVLDLARVRLS